VNRENKANAMFLMGLWKWQCSSSWFRGRGHLVMSMRLQGWGSIQQRRNRDREKTSSIPMMRSFQTTSGKCYLKLQGKWAIKSLGPLLLNKIRRKHMIKQTEFWMKLTEVSWICRDFWEWSRALTPIGKRGIRRMRV
jgi:hypothetical protein